MTPKVIVSERDDGGQVVELGGEDFPWPGPVAQRRLGQQELEGPAGLVEDFLAGHEAGRHRRPRRLAGSSAKDRIRRAYSAVCSRPGMIPGWKFRRVRAVASRLAHRLLDGRQAVAQPGPEGGHLIDGCLGQGRAGSPGGRRRPRSASAHAVSSRSEGTDSPRSMRETVAWLMPARLGDLPAGQPREHANPPQLGAEPGELRFGAHGTVLRSRCRASQACQVSVQRDGVALGQPPRCHAALDGLGCRGDLRTRGSALPRHRSSGPRTAGALRRRTARNRGQAPPAPGAPTGRRCGSRHRRPRTPGSRSAGNAGIRSGASRAPGYGARTSRRP